MSGIEIFYLVLLVTAFGVVDIYVYVQYRRGKAEIAQRRKDELQKREQMRKIAPDIYKELYNKGS